MKKIFLSLSIVGLISVVNAQDSPEVIQSKIDELGKQKKSIESEIEGLKKQLPAPVVKPWTYKGNFGINFGQNLLGDWAAGGFSNFSLQGGGHVEANYLKDRHSWNNGLDANLGFVKNYDAVNDNVDFPLQKSVDMIQLNSTYLYDLQKGNLKLGVNANFLSQILKTYDNADPNKLISDFLAPGILDVSPGLQWTPSKYFKLFFSPASGRFTFVTNDTIINDAAANRFGNDVGQKTRSELGAKVDAIFEKELVKNLSIRSRLQLFNNYTRPQDQIDAIYSSRANIDVVFQTDLFYKLTKNIALNFGFQTIKDDDQRFSNVDNPDADGLKSVWQLRQNFGVGMVFGF